MRVKKLKVLGICGSVRENSSSHVVLDYFAAKISHEIEFITFKDLATIPAFDGREVDPVTVKDFKEEIKKANGVVICTPEYAFGVPGALKNALDWTVGTGEFVDKPVALITASSQGERGHESLQHTLTAISAKLHPDTTLLISFIRAKVKEGKISDGETIKAVDKVVETFIKNLM